MYFILIVLAILIAIAFESFAVFFILVVVGSILISFYEKEEKRKINAFLDSFFTNEVSEKIYNLFSRCANSQYLDWGEESKKFANDEIINKDFSERSERIKSKVFQEAGERMMEIINSRVEREKEERRELERRSFEERQRRNEEERKKEEEKR